MVFKKGQKSWNAGKKLSEAHRLKIALSRLRAEREKERIEMEHAISRLKSAVRAHENNTKLRPYALAVIYITIWLIPTMPSLWLLWVIIHLFAVLMVI